MRRILTTLALCSSMVSHAGILQRGKVQLICHRTANRDIPENTLESLAYAARMGCNIVELDIRTTLDGTLVLHHDGYLERPTDGMGDVALTSYDELQLLDAGGWMSPRFAPMRIPRFDDALHLARSLNVGLDLDIKQPGEGAAIFAALSREGMVERVIFGGEDGYADDLRALMPRSMPDSAAWFGPDVTAQQIAEAHAAGKFTVANFSANAHEMDLPAMRAAVAAGIDAINVDYPRLGADAVGRSVEARLATLAAATRTGDVPSRTVAIRELSKYAGFPLQPLFVSLLHDPNEQIAHAAALALVLARPSTSSSVFIAALSSPEASARKSAAWALGMTHAAYTVELLPLLRHTDPTELKEVLLALSRMPGSVAAADLLPFLDNSAPTVRAAAALALAAHQPEVAAKAIPALLLRDEQRSAADYAVYVQHGKHKLSPPEIDVIIEQYREHMKLIHALEMLPPSTALPLLTTEAFRVAEDSSHVTSLLAGYGLWDLIANDPTSALAALSSTNVEVADRAEWILVKADPSILPSVRAALASATSATRPRLLHILAWQGDAAALPLLQNLLAASPGDENVSWAIDKIRTLQRTLGEAHGD
ncbi:MAG: glycerophosphodiester phosphodiesterase family protein [Acidobacteriota bacterium]